MIDLTEARAIDRAMNATRDPAEMRALITRRRLVRAGLAFEFAMERLERENPVPAEIPDPFPFVIR